MVKILDKIKRGSFYVVPDSIAKRRSKLGSFDAVFCFFLDEFGKRSDGGDIKAQVAWDFMVHQQVNDYMQLAFIVLYVDIGRRGQLPVEFMVDIGKQNVLSVVDTFIELGFSDRELNCSTVGASLLSEEVIVALTEMKNEYQSES